MLTKNSTFSLKFSDDNYRLEKHVSSNGCQKIIPSNSEQAFFAFNKIFEACLGFRLKVLNQMFF